MQCAWFALQNFRFFLFCLFSRTVVTFFLIRALHIHRRRRRLNVCFRISIRCSFIFLFLFAYQLSLNYAALRTLTPRCAALLVSSYCFFFSDLSLLHKHVLILYFLPDGCCLFFQYDAVRILFSALIRCLFLSMCNISTLFFLKCLIFMNFFLSVQILCSISSIFPNFADSCALFYDGGDGARR